MNNDKKWDRVHWVCHFVLNGSTSGTNPLHCANTIKINRDIPQYTAHTMSRVMDTDTQGK